MAHHEHNSIAEDFPALYAIVKSEVEAGSVCHSRFGDINA